MLQAEADRMLSESTQDKSDDSIKAVFGETADQPTDKQEGNSVPPSSFQDLQERRRTSNEYRVRGRHDSSSSDGSELDVEQSLLVNEKEPEGGDLSMAIQPEDEQTSSRPASRLQRPSASRLSVNTKIPTTPESVRQRPTTAQGVSFPTERVLSPPNSTFASGIPRACRRSDPSRPAVQTVASGSGSAHPPSSFVFGSPSKAKPGRARSGSAEAGSSRIGQVPPGAFGMGVGYSAGIGGISRPPSVARSRRESQETIVDADASFDKSEVSPYVHGINSFQSADVNFRHAEAIHVQPLATGFEPTSTSSSDL